ncbi:serine hydrolase [Paraflavitalea sp. CAU 1676]|uniref:serine hydrolase n=1 Tax=Paraflavitalea sp. CAU 1676 TaxID=3032598 RepID=UPI0023DC5D7C|nr:serine hydrolase [Paraflavitalea sp. CAU 1676]MDF2190915.1 serine hydrolase [Paraflavitalea sp. CAU 1676]
MLPKINTPIKPCFLLICLLTAAGLLGQDKTPAFVRDSLDTYVERALKDWQIPGVAVCVIKDGRIVVMKGYGIKEAGTDNKVDTNTLFMIGSNSKAFTGTALAMLEADKKLSLDDKVQKWLPDFKLYDPWVAKEATLRDLLCHRLGFETFQGDFMYFDSDLTLQQVREKFGKVKPVYSFRSKWGYTNAAFLTAGEVIPKVTGKTWAQFLEERIFKPLGMNNTLALSKDIASAPNKASAHTVDKGVLKKIPYGNIDNMAPAGSISSSVSDMSHWVQALLSGGRYNDQPVINPNAIGQTRVPQSILGNGGHMYNRAHFSLYGLGWFLEEYSGRKFVGHTGGVNGFVTSVAMLPEEALGIIVFTNTDANNFYEALRYEIMDAYLGLPYRNYSNVYLGYNRTQEKHAADWLKKKQDTIANLPAPLLPIAAYAGDYNHAVYGKMSIKPENGKLVARFEHHHGRFATLDPLGGNRFLATFNEALYGAKEWPFTIDKGKVKSVTVTVADFVEFTPYEFYKIK